MSVKVTTGALVRESPTISIIIPNYMTAGIIAETLDSVFAQTFTDYEAIVINDGSPDIDELKTVLEKYRDRIVFIDKSTNDGLAAVRNIAVESARGSVFSFLDSDDIWRPNFLEEVHAHFEKGNFDVAYSSCEAFYSGTNKRLSFLGNNPPQTGEITRQMMIEGRCHILPSGALVRRASFENAGGFDGSLRWTEDFDLWVRMLVSGARMGFLRKELFDYRLRADSLSGDAVAWQERSADVWRLLREKIDFTPEENRQIERHIASAEAAELRARGRAFIAEKNWPMAKEMFAAAAKKSGELGLPLKHRLKMRLVNILLAVSPELVYRMQHHLR